MSNPHTFRKTGPRAYAVTLAETGAHLGTVDRVSPDHVKTHTKWRATMPDGTDLGSYHYSRDAAARVLADRAADDAEGITPAPSRLYGFRRPPTLLPGEDPATVVQVVERSGGRWLGTPARYNAATLADLGSGATLAIDAGAGWRLSQGDTAALAAHARGVLAADVAAQRAALRGAGYAGPWVEPDGNRTH